MYHAKKEDQCDSSGLKTQAMVGQCALAFAMAGAVTERQARDCRCSGGGGWELKSLLTDITGHSAQAEEVLDSLVLVSGSNHRTLEGERRLEIMAIKYLWPSLCP